MKESLENSGVIAVPKWLSPVQEHHINFLQEEEFHADRHSNCLTGPNCSSVRSGTTDKGETDVLVVYQSSESFDRVAILLEDKIRAGSQRQQAERYRMRSELGRNSGEWDRFWTCLIAPKQYTHDNPDLA